MSLLPFFQWLAATEGSTALRESLFMYPLTFEEYLLAMGEEGLLGVVDQVDATRIVVRATEELDPAKPGVAPMREDALYGPPYVNHEDLATVVAFVREGVHRPVFDLAMIFAANINYDGCTAYLHLNERVMETLRAAETQIRPLQRRGTKVLLSLVSGFSTGSASTGSPGLLELIRMDVFLPRSISIELMPPSRNFFMRYLRICTSAIIFSR